jgi:protein subunit release factor B
MPLNEEFITIRSSNPFPPGGQHVGCVSPAIEVTHDLGISVTCNLGRSQLKNKNIALAAIEYALIEAGITEPILFKTDD